ncbi:hypothetical protein PRK78_006274 [Emydomyces testavorans]|uniref:YTH domain-containing protein n=1 Tax=Emydomyces testavorans TaxID=2070801 RepID=A0AAF0DNW2_9EURO|nr:hypothetical protein PRK78_006274 [Emydomyces testavorans]
MADSSVSQQILSSKRAAVLASLSQRRHPHSAGVAKVSQNQGLEGGSVLNRSSSMTENAIENSGSASPRIPGLSMQLNDRLDGRGDRSATKVTGMNRTLSRGKSITAEIDGLLAEGKAAANLSATEKMTNKNGGDAPLIESTNNVTQRDNGLKNLPEFSETHKHPISREFDSFKSGAATPIEKMSIASHNNSDASSGEVSVLPAIQSLSSYKNTQQPAQNREIQRYEPPKRIPMGPKGYALSNKEINYSKQRNTNAMKPLSPTAQMSPALEFEHEFLHLEQSEVEDLREWLEFTNYYDEEYRIKTLHRRRRLAALKQEMAELKKEEQYEREALTRRHDSPLPSHSKPHASKAVTLATSARGTSYRLTSDSVPQSLKTPKRAVLDNTTSYSNAGSLGDMGHDSTTDPTMHLSREGNLKRESSSTRPPHVDAAKKPRLETWEKDGNDLDDQNSIEEINPSHLTSFEQPQLKFQNDDSPRSYGKSPSSRGRGSSQVRGRGRARYPGFVSRETAHGGMQSLDKPTHYMTENAHLILEVGETRFFLIKSYSAENVLASQHEGTWSTQIKNMHKMADAFDNCRHVILLFSVNQSKAFQGYARMETTFGDPSANLPKWADSYKWEASPAFRVRWLNTSITYFKHVAHLTNSYNENAMAFLGRDGQEIEPYCGLELCSILDQFEKFKPL